jgi:arylsulfatase A-like enzyme
MPPAPPLPSETSRPASSLLTLAVWIGLVTGFAELAALGPDLIGPRFCLCSRDALWMTPAFDALLFALIGLGLTVVARSGRISWRVAAGILAGMGVGLALMHFPRLHILARLALAVGVAVQVTRLLAGRVPRASRAVRRSLPWLAASVCAIAAVTVGLRTFQERLLERSRPAAASGAPNILLLILDTVRAANLSLYGYARATSPELERFAERGIVFDRAFSPASWTTPSHASMFTGRWAIDLDADWRQALGRRWPTLAQVLRGRGYATAGFVANEVYAGWESGLMRGFEHYDDYPLTLLSAMQGTGFGQAMYSQIRSVIAPLFKRLPLLWRLRVPRQNQHRPANEINQAFLHWLDRNSAAPFFVFLNYMDAHSPFTPVDSFRYRYAAPEARQLSDEAWDGEPENPLTPADVWPKQAVYDGSIAYLDSQLGDLFRELERRHLLDNTLVIVTADHGEEFAEHGLVDHGNSLYRLSVQVPLVIRFDGQVPAGRRVTTPVSLRNVAATILELIKTDGAALPGRSLARFWAGGDTSPDTIVTGIREVENKPAWYPASQGDLNSVAFDGWRYIRNEGNGAEELFEFENDILERWNLIGSTRGDALLPRYRAAVASLKASAPESRLAGR